MKRLRLAVYVAVTAQIDDEDTLMSNPAWMDTELEQKGLTGGRRE